MKDRIAPGLLCVLMTALCFCYAEFRHQLQGWWQSHGGGVPYVLFFIFLIYTIIPKVGWALRICALVVLVTCGLEVLQLWNPELLATFRKTRFGAALLGTTFVWNDFPPYFIGGAIGWVTLRANRWGNEKESGDDFGSAHEKRTTE